MILYIHMCFVFFVMDIVAYDPKKNMSPVLPESPKKPTGFAQKSGHPLGPQYRL
jgi:hypothetical protein